MKINLLIRARGALGLILLGLCSASACSSGGKTNAQVENGAGAGNSDHPPSDDAGAPTGVAGEPDNGGGSGVGGTPGSSAGADDTAGEGGAAGDAPVDPCAACPAGLCVGGQCVQCSVTHDACPDGQYCTTANTCAKGCKTGASCASGVCSADHDCKSCISDQECSAVHVCGASACATACTAADEGGSVGCTAGLTCCSLHCVDAKTDSQHCGACGTACADGQFCGLTGCHASTLAGACSVGKLTLILDGQSGNEEPGRAIAQALAASCGTAPVVREVSQDVADALNVTSGRPVAGGDELLISAGGSYYARLVSYVSTAPVAPVYGTLNVDKLEYRTRIGDKLVVSNPFDGPHDAQDVFVIQFMRDETSGSLVLNAQGFWQAGTAAAAYYFVHAMLPTLATQTHAWYAYNWADADGDLAPDLNEMTFIASGD